MDTISNATSRSDFFDMVFETGMLFVPYVAHLPTSAVFTLLRPKNLQGVVH